MRKSLLLILAIAVSVAPILVGCSGGEEADKSAPTTPARTTNDPSKPASPDNAGTAAPQTPL